MDFMTGFRTMGVRVCLETESFLGVVVCYCDNDAWNRIGSCCEGTVKCPVEWFKF